jgi:hypothetical protein
LPKVSIGHSDSPFNPRANNNYNAGAPCSRTFSVWEAATLREKAKRDAWLTGRGKAGRLAYRRRQSETLGLLERQSETLGLLLLAGFEETFELPDPGWMAHLAQRFGLDLADALACDAKLTAYFLESPAVAIHEAEPLLKNLPFALG